MEQRAEVLRALVTERLTAAAAEVLALFQRTIAGYEEELSRARAELSRARAELSRARAENRERRPGDGSDVQLKANPPQTKEFESSTTLDRDQSEIHQIKLEQDEMCVKQEDDVGHPSVVVQVSDAEDESRPLRHLSRKNDSAACSSTQNTEMFSNGKDVKSKSYVCGECGKAFGWRATWRRHVATHSDSSPYTCAVCSKRFPQKSHLVTHMVTHTGEKPFSCPECAARFSQKQNLVRHMNIHSGEKSFSCPVCGKLFSHKHSVQLHLLTHTGEKPFSCSLCDARFTKKPHLNRHMKCCHNGEKPYSCPVCQKGFTQRFDVQRHLKVHEKETDQSGRAAALSAPLQAPRSARP